MDLKNHSTLVARRTWKKQSLIRYCLLPITFSMWKP